jgi:hypothetical protein
MPDPVDHERPTNPGPAAIKRQPRVAAIVAIVGALTLIVSGLVLYVLLTRLTAEPGSSRTVVRPTGTILMAVRDLSRLETNELHMEKVIDLTDKQSRFFGLIDTADAILLIAAGDVTVGIDLAKLEDRDLVVDRETGAAQLMLPAPEVLSTRLDEEHTYVYRRNTGLLAERNEHLESKARQEAVRAITEAARDAGTMEKARQQAEREVQQLLQRLGIKKATIGFRPA